MCIIAVTQLPPNSYLSALFFLPLYVMTFFDTVLCRLFFALWLLRILLTADGSVYSLYSVRKKKDRNETKKRILPVSLAGSFTTQQKILTLFSVHMCLVVSVNRYFRNHDPTLPPAADVLWNKSWHLSWNRGPIFGGTAASVDDENNLCDAAEERWLG